MAWTDEQIDTLKQLHAIGTSYSDIGKELLCTRNAIAGKLHRLGLTDGAPERKDKPKLRRPRSKPEERFWHMTNDRELPPRAAETAVKATSKTFWELAYGDCKWPLGGINEPAKYFCGIPALLGHPYCAKHTWMAHTPSHPPRFIAVPRS